MGGKFLPTKFSKKSKQSFSDINGYSDSLPISRLQLQIIWKRQQAY